MSMGGGFSPESGRAPMEAVLNREQQEELRRFDALMTNVLHTVSGNSNIRLKHSMPGSKMWAYMSGTDDVYYDPADVLERKKKGEEEVLKGIIAHEGGHVAITVIQEVVPEHLWEEVGFSSLLMVTEELPTDQVVRVRAPGAGDWVDTARRTSIREGDEKNTEAKKAAEEEGEELPPLSRFNQIRNLMLYSHFGEMDRGYDPEVIALFREILPKLQEIERTLPEEHADRREVNRKQFDRFKIFFREVWPKLKTLLAKDLEEEAKRQHEIKQQQEAIKKAWEELSEEEKNLLRQMALAIFKQIEDEILKELRGILNVGSIPTHAERDAKKGAPSEPSEEPQGGPGAGESVDDALGKLEGKPETPPSTTVYDQYYNEVREVEQDLYKRLDALFRKSAKPQVQATRTGSRAHLPNVFRRAGARAAGATQVEERVFELREVPQKTDYAFVIVVDGSSSMSWGNKEAKPKKFDTLRGTIVFVEVLNRLGVPAGEVVFGTGKSPAGIFDEEVMVVKGIRDPLDNTGREIMAQVLDCSGGTPIAEGIALASQELDKVHAKHKFIILMTDGVPNDMTAAQREVRKARKEKRQLTLAIGLGPKTDRVAEIAKCAIPNVEMKDFAQQTGDLLENIIRNPKAFEELDPVASEDEPIPPLDVQDDEEWL